MVRISDPKGGQDTGISSTLTLHGDAPILILLSFVFTAVVGLGLMLSWDLGISGLRLAGLNPECTTSEKGFKGDIPSSYISKAESYSN